MEGDFGLAGLLANLVMRRYRTDIPDYWKERSVEEVAEGKGNQFPPHQPPALGSVASQR